MEKDELMNYISLNTTLTLITTFFFFLLDIYGKSQRFMILFIFIFVFCHLIFYSICVHLSARFSRYSFMAWMWNFHIAFLMLILRIIYIIIIINYITMNSFIRQRNIRRRANKFVFSSLRIYKLIFHSSCFITAKSIYILVTRRHTRTICIYTYLPAVYY